MLSETRKNLLQSQEKNMELQEELKNLQLTVECNIKENAILRRNIESLKAYALGEDVKRNFETEFKKLTAVSNEFFQDLCYQFLKRNHENLFEMPQFQPTLDTTSKCNIKGSISDDSNSKDQIACLPSDRTLMVHNLAHSVKSHDLRNFMHHFGAKFCSVDAHGELEGQGIVIFDSISDMMNAYELLNNKVLHGRRIRLLQSE